MTILEFGEVKGEGEGEVLLMTTYDDSSQPSPRSSKQLI